MQKIITICDRCQAEAEDAGDWATIEHCYASKTYSEDNPGREASLYNLCPACSEDMTLTLNAWIDAQ